MKIKSFLQAKLKNQRVLLRVDYNVPLKNGRVMDDTRIMESLPTIKKLLQQNCSIIIVTHLGRPGGKVDPQLTLSPIAKRTQKLLGEKVIFQKEPLGEKLINYCQNLKPRQIVMLENIRFYPGEEKNDLKLAENLSKLANVYIDDAFGCAHRAHASIHAITKFLPSYAGLLLEKEVVKLSLLFHSLAKPVSFVIGGAKIDTKINLIRSFIDKVDHFIFGGGIANTFLSAQKYQLADSLVQKNMIKTAQSISTEIHQKRKNLHLPKDFTIAKKVSNLALTKNFSNHRIPDGYGIYDLGKHTANDFADLLRHSKTIIWNGPMGVTEYRPFRNGTRKVATAIVQAGKQGATTILGGGDTIEAIKTLGFKPNQFTHVSTGGGAMLEFLEKGMLPGIEVLLA